MRTFTTNDVLTFLSEINPASAPSEVQTEFGVMQATLTALLESSIRKYQNRAIQAAQVIEELIGLAKQVREETAKGQELGLSEDEVAFYDALEVNDSAVKVLGDATLKTIARELVETVRRNTTIDWTVEKTFEQTSGCW